MELQLLLLVLLLLKPVTDFQREWSKRFRSVEARANIIVLF